MKNTIVQLLIIAMLGASAVFMQACPKKDAVRAAVDASYRLPASTNDLIAKITEGRDRGIITVDQSKKFGELLSKVAASEVIYIGMVKAMKNAIDATGKPDAAAMKSLRDFFDVQIIGPFLNVLEIARVLSGDSVQVILLAVTAVRLLLHTIAGGIGSNFSNQLAGGLGAPNEVRFA